MSFDLIENIRHHGFKRLLLAVSGGLDSICLAHYFIKNRETLGIEWLGIAHVHHGLREGTADRDAKFVEEFAKSHDVPFFLKRLDGEALKNAEGSLEENARDGRYKALIEIALDPSASPQDDDKGAIVTAHHAGDQAETMYMRLRRGTTLAGLRGIQETRTIQEVREIPDQVGNDTFCIHIYRPFLNVTRAELLDYARKNKLNWCEDESNADVKFARNKIRHEILPQLEHECSGVTKQLGRIAELADKAYAKVMDKCENVFAPCLLNGESLDPIASTRLQDDVLQDPSTSPRFAQDDKKEVPAQGGHDNTNRAIALDKKKLNKILREHAKADLSELFRLWLSEKGFRFPMGFFYAPKEPAHVKIPVRAVYRKRSIIKIRHTVWICEFEDVRAASKFVSCEMNEKDYNEST
ncbi:MAG: tRNA lysidine(34) synthetase TilS [Fibrobacter sp.]|nr:tRNA lysidine(34) synthetase TilS [Fibrobacter sp.]